MTTNSKNKTTRHAIMACALGLAGVASANTSEKYVYDASGNMVEKTINGVVTRMSYDASNQLASIETPAGKETCSYEMSGCLESAIKENGNLSRTQRTGYAGKVLESNASGVTANLFYNAEGQLVGTIAGGKSSAYAWDGNSLVAEGDQVFVNEEHASGGVPVLSNGGNVVVSDYLGSSLFMEGRSYEGSAFGEGMEGGRFTGKPYVKESDSFAFPYRSYYASTARWSMSDPSGFPDGKNNYAYVNGDPVNKIDPLGLVSFSPLVVYSTPGAPSDVIGTFAQPSGSGDPGDTDTTYVEKWQHQSWVRVGHRYGGVNETLNGGFNYTGGYSVTFSIDATIFHGGVSANATNGSSDNYNVVPGQDERHNVHAVVSKADRYQIAQDWEWYGNAWHQKGSIYWKSNLNLGLLYRAYHGLEYEKQKEL